MHANLTESQAQVVLANLPDESKKPYDRALLKEGKERLRAAVLSHSQSFYDHLIDQGKSPTEARAHVRHKFGVSL